MNVTVKLLKEISLVIKGKVVDATTPAPRFQLALDLGSLFSPEPFKNIGKRRTFCPPRIHLNNFLLKGTCQERPPLVSIADGLMVLDESRISFSGAVKAFSKPDIKFNIDLDTLDLDRYLPPSHYPNTPGGITCR